MAVALVSAGVASTTAAASATPAFGQSTAAGNLLVAVVKANISNPITTSSSGWVSAVGLDSSVTGAFRIFYKPNCGAAETAPTFSATSATSIVAQLTEWSGAATTNCVDRTNSNNNGATVSPLLVDNSFPDTLPGDLFVALINLVYSTAATKTFTSSLNNGMSIAREDSSAATSTTAHWDFCYGVGSTGSLIDRDSLTFTTTKISGTTWATASFKTATDSFPAGYAENRSKTYLRMHHKDRLWLPEDHERRIHLPTRTVH